LVGNDPRPRRAIALVDLWSGPDEIAVLLALTHHLPAVSVKRVVDDPLGGIHRVIVLEAQMAETFRDRFEARRFGLLIERIVGVGTVDDLASSTSAGSSRSLYFFKIASNEHSLP